MIIILPQNYNEIVYPWGFSGSYFSSDQLFQFHHICTTYNYWRQTFAPENLQEIEIRSAENTCFFMSAQLLGGVFIAGGVMTDPLMSLINPPYQPTPPFISVIFLNLLKVFTLPCSQEAKFIQKASSAGFLSWAGQVIRRTCLDYRMLVYKGWLSP